MERKLSTIFATDVVGFRKIKTPSRESLFYFAATLFKLEEEKKSAETLKQAFKMTDMSVEDFLLTQHYQNPELKQELLEILETGWKQKIEKI